MTTYGDIYQQMRFTVNGRILESTYEDGARKLVGAQDGEVVEVAIYVRTVGTGGNVQVDVNKNDVTMYTTQANRPTYLTTDTNWVVATLPDITSISATDVITVDVDDNGTGVWVDLVVLVTVKLPQPAYA